MTGAALPVISTNTFAASDTFSYTCHRCLRCCSHKRIHVNPYEVYRLARNRGMSTTEFLSAHTLYGGTELARRDDGSCVFLTEEGCGVHPDRPFVCRIYPLGRHVVRGQTDTYFMTETHPESEGVFSQDGTVESFLESQGAAPFADAADRYYALFLRMVDVMAQRAANDAQEHDSAVAVLSAAPEIQEWLDIDAVCATGDDGVLMPLSPEEAMARHIALLAQEFLPAVHESTLSSEAQST